MEVLRVESAESQQKIEETIEDMQKVSEMLAQTAAALNVSTKKELPIKAMLMSDPPVQPTGFGRVTRELLQRLSPERYRLAMLALGWAGSSKFPGVQTYSASVSDSVCANTFPVAASDFGAPFVLWSLMDPWQTGWLSHPGKNVHSNHRLELYLTQHRHQIAWVGHYPVDGEGMREGPPFWFEDFFSGPDCLVFMSEFGRDTCAKTMDLGSRWHETIQHAVNTRVYQPLSQQKAREILTDMQEKRLRAQEKDLDLAFRMDRPIVLAIMNNRRRKYWPQLLEAVAMAKKDVPDLGLIGVCGERAGDLEDSWPLERICVEKGLRVDHVDRDPDVWLIPQIGGPVEREDMIMSVLHSASDLSALLSAGEGSGLPQLEAHACGRACVIGRYSASVEQIVDPAEAIDPSGWYYDGNNCVKRPVYKPREVAARIKELLRDASARVRIGKLGVEQARQRDWSMVLPRWEEIFAKAWASVSGSER